MQWPARLARAAGVKAVQKSSTKRDASFHSGLPGCVAAMRYACGSLGPRALPW